MKKLGWVLPLLLLSSMSNAAQEVKNLNTYIGGGAGITKDHILSQYYNETVTSGKLFAGMAYNTYSGIEASYAYLGSFANDQVTEDALAFNLVAFVPLAENIRMIVKGGIYYYKLDVSSTVTDDNDITYGIGLKYNLDYHSALRGEWERYKNLGGSDVDMLSLSYSYRFGRH
ncbi:hypothetical protein MNBD_GAMMA24-2739 [hydrothermal vent metagenome]|uniref:Outer membrane protein beta-barrel domain-containing protein n=1 Tax=hydrothermal vent metagenome TaxID=652676 RepID=A0A3B1B2F0_9ZZZZ